MKMLNFFKKTKQAAKHISDINNMISIDEQIYKDVYSAQELILAEANAILNKPNGYNKERHERLEKLLKLGFANASEVQEFKEMESARSGMESIKKTIEYYQQTYPLNKFISAGAVKHICNKYNLLLTVASDYIAEIPEKNQKEIITFRIKRKDVRTPHEVIGSVSAFLRLDKVLYFNPETDYESFQNMKIEGQYLLIIAPIHKLKTEGKIKQGHILKINDPIVLQPVTQGYLIVSSWGLEAADEVVVNPINN